MSAEFAGGVSPLSGHNRSDAYGPMDSCDRALLNGVRGRAYEIDLSEDTAALHERLQPYTAAGRRTVPTHLRRRRR